MDVGGSECLDAYRDISGTTPGMGEVELSLERKSRATHDYREIGGRTNQEDRVEPGRLHGSRTTPGMEEVEKVWNTFSR